MTKTMTDNRRNDDQIIAQAREFGLTRLAETDRELLLDAYRAARRYVTALDDAAAAPTTMYDEPAHVYAPPDGARDE